MEVQYALNIQILRDLLRGNTRLYLNIVMFDAYR